MQRILSVETSRSSNTAREFVTKRLCYSILFSVAFLFLLAGYLLGRYTTDKALLLKKAYLQQRLSLEEKNPMEIMQNLSSSIRSINNLTIETQIKTTDAGEIYNRLKCTDHKAFLPDYGEFEKDIAIKINRILATHLDSLANCFSSIDNLLRNISSTNN